MSRSGAVSFWLLLAAIAVLAQQALTTYPESTPETSAFWTFVSLLLLWCVYRQSNTARLLFAFIAALGFTVFAWAAINDPIGSGSLLAALYGVQAGAMVVAPVRVWTNRAARAIPIT